MAKWYPPDIDTDEKKAAYDKETDELYAQLRRESENRIAALRAAHENDPWVEGMPVDLSRGTEGICERLGRRWYTSVRPLGNDIYEVRIESGWYEDYYRDGSPAGGRGKITFFAPCHFASPQAWGLPTQTTP